MKQSEINIGDWVQSKSDQSIIQIKTHWDVYNAKDFEPVSITLEILKKNGFEKCEDSILYIWKFSKLQLGSISCFKTANKTWNFDIFGKYLSPIKVRGDFEYVHELQHALRLCKIDKEIKL